VTLDEALVYPRIVCGADTLQAEGYVTEVRSALRIRRRGQPKRLSAQRKRHS
jgi:hypothetical protein